MNKIELAKIKEKALEDHIPIIMDDTLEVIENELKENKPNTILEIGTAVGYSAICFSEFLNENGKIDTIEREADRVIEARKNIKNLIKSLKKDIPEIENHIFKSIHNCQVDTMVGIKHDGKYYDFNEIFEANKPKKE